MPLPQGGMNYVYKTHGPARGRTRPRGCCGQHSHEHAHEHVSGHHHEHGDKPELTPEQTLALMSYMLDHNRSHAEELHASPTRWSTRASRRQRSSSPRRSTTSATATTGWRRPSGW